MIQALTETKIVTFEEFVQWKPEVGRYELYDGEIVEMSQPLGDHEMITGFLSMIIAGECLRLNLPYLISKTVLAKPPESESAYSPDVLLLNRPNLVNEPLWRQASTVTQGASVPLVVEVVSTNWRVDYLRKAGDYEAIGIPEYWIVDYLALGGKRFIGSPKQPTISIYEMVDGEYQVNQFKGDERIISSVFKELTLTANQIFRAGD
jgi:Uma2 family endonuclease